MREKNRRKFLKVLTIGVFFPQFLFPKSVFSENKSKFFTECQCVLVEWKKSEIMSPLNYLHFRGLNPSTKLSNLNNEDMLNNQFLNVKGLIIGKAEAAFLALLAEKNSKNMFS
jgi:hypothetical protein